MKTFTISKKSLCWNCPYFECLCTIVDIDEGETQMFIHEIEKTGTCMHEANAPGDELCIVTNIFETLNDALEHILKHINPILCSAISGLSIIISDIAKQLDTYSKQLLIEAITEDIKIEVSDEQ